METFEGAGDDGGEKDESPFLGGDFLWELCFLSLVSRTWWKERIDFCK